MAEEAGNPKRLTKITTKHKKIWIAAGGGGGAGARQAHAKLARASLLRPFNGEASGLLTEAMRLRMRNQASLASLLRPCV